VCTDSGRLGSTGDREAEALAFRDVPERALHALAQLVEADFANVEADRS
jgi:hypothetical protein